MILDALFNAAAYELLHAALPAAFAFLRREDLASLPDGKHTIIEGLVRAEVAHETGRTRKQARLEAHDRHLDVQYVIEGCDEMGWKPRAACAEPLAAVDPERDVQFFGDRPEAWVRVKPGQFTIFFPSDAHAPLVSARPIHKVVVKIAI